MVLARLGHLHKKELWLQDQVAAKNVQPGRVPSEDNEDDTKYMERDRIKKCVTKMGMLFAGAWAREQLPVVLGTEVIIGEDLIEVRVGRLVLCYSLKSEWYCLAVRVLCVIHTCQLEM